MREAKHFISPNAAFFCGVLAVSIFTYLAIVQTDRIGFRRDKTTSSSEPFIPIDSPRPDIVAEKQSTNESLWLYTSPKPTGSGAKVRIARTFALNNLSLAAADASTIPSLVVRQTSLGLSAMLSVDQGRLLCKAHSADSIFAKFDEGSFEPFRCAEAEDGRGDIIFILDAERFVSRLSHSHQTIIDATFDGDGVKQIEFNTAGLELPPSVAVMASNDGPPVGRPGAMTRKLSRRRAAP